MSVPPLNGAISLPVKYPGVLSLQETDGGLGTLFAFANIHVTQLFADAPTTTDVNPGVE